MKNVIVSFGMIEYDGRLKELINVFSNFGEVTVLCCSDSGQPGKFKVSKSGYLSKKTYADFLKYVKTEAKKIGKTDILVCDNLFAAMPVLKCKRIFKPEHIVQDVRELYLYKESHGSTKLFTYFERKLMRQADAVLAANEERAEIMQKEYSLKKRPLVFENVRFLDGEYDKAALDEKYKDEFKYKFNIISTSGLFMSRDSDKLILAMKELDDNFGLYFVGTSSDSDMAQYKELTEKNNLKNIHVLGKVPLNELRYLVSKCQIGAVHYHKRNTNNLYCASGKIYEFLHEGLPIVTTENPPLKNFLEKHNVGIADDGFADAIKKIASEYEEYRTRVHDFIKDISPEQYNKGIADLIKNELSK